MPTGPNLSAVEGFINHIWLTVKNDREINETIGLKFISHRWEEMPYWHLWFNELRGVFKLELKQLLDSTGYDWAGEFAVKYYPAENEAWFNGLSLFEQICRKSRIFKNFTRFESGGCPCCSTHELNGRTEILGIPDSQNQGKLPEDFFFAGKILLAKSEKDWNGLEGVIVGFETQNYWRVIMTDDYYLQDEEGSPAYKALSRGDADRNFPGLEVTSFLYRKIVSSLKALDKYYFNSEETICRDGVLFYSDGETLRKNQDGCIKHWLGFNQLKNLNSGSLPPFRKGGWTL